MAGSFMVCLKLSVYGVNINIARFVRFAMHSQQAFQRKSGWEKMIIAPLILVIGESALNR